MFRTINTALLATLLCQCGNPLEVGDQEFSLIVYGVYTATDGPVGNSSPEFYKMSLTNVELTRTDGEIITFEPESTDEIRVIDREQVILTELISDYEEDSFSSISANFVSDVTVGGKYDDYDLSLTQSQIVHEESVTFDKGKSAKMTITILWRNTINRDADAESETIEEPTFETQYDIIDP